MRRIIILTMYMAAAIVLAASCNKIEDKPVSVEGNGRTVINGVAESIGIGTRADMAYCYEVIWRSNDQIYVSDGTKDDTFTLSGGADTNKGQFTEDNAKGISGNIEAFYPASLKTEGGYVWPATQSNNQVAPMYAKQSITGADGEVVSFSSLGAMLQIVFNSTTPDITVTSITLKDSKKPLSGLFTVTDGQAIMEENSANPGVTLDLGTSGVPVGVAAKYFYIAIPAGDYNGGKLTLTFTDDVHHKECVMTSTTFPNVDRNTVGRITLAGDFKDQQFTVKFDMNNSGMTGNFTACPTDLTNVEAYNIIEAPIPFAENYGFRGWYKEASCEHKWDFENDEVTGNMTLYAKWVTDPLDESGKAKINGHDYVKLGGYYWATENVTGSGAGYSQITKNDTYGDYYAQNNDNALNAAQSWGNENGRYWTLPSAEHCWNALLSNCDWEWKTNYNDTKMNGYLVTGREDNYELDHSIFLPATGCYIDGLGQGSTYMDSLGEICCYWSTDEYWHLCCGFSWGLNIDRRDSGTGMAVRPVAE